MTSRRRRRWLPAACWAILAWVGGVVYLVGAVGVPLPTGMSVSSGAFPCAGGRCGCATAEHCWRSCCCYTFEQKLAWARQKQVTPPGYVLEEARTRGLAHLLTGQETDRQASTRSCCDRRPEQETTRRRTEPPSAGLLALRSRGDGQPPAELAAFSARLPRKQTPVRSSAIVLLDALNCSGAGSQFQPVVLLVPPPAAAAVRPVENSAARPAQPARLDCSADHEPPTPPPRPV